MIGLDIGARALARRAMESTRAYPVAAGETAGSDPGDVLNPQYPHGDIRRYGGLGNGVASVVEDTAAFSAAIAWATANGGGKVYLPDTGNFYAYNGIGEVACDYLELAGDGNTRIRHVDPDQSDWYKGVIIYPGTYAANNAQSIVLETGHDIGDVLAGATSVTTDTAASAAQWASGDLIVVVDGGTHVKGTNNRWNAGEVNEVATVDPATGVVSLKRPLLNGYTTRNASPRAIKVNAGTVGNGTGGRVAQITRGLNFHGIIFEVADTDEVNGGELTSPVIHSPLQVGATYESRFDVGVRANAGWSGNMWARCQVKARIESAGQILDTGYLTCGSTFDIEWTEMGNTFGSGASSLLFCNEGSNNSAIRVKGRGPTWNGTNVINAGACNHNASWDVELDLPAANSPDSVIECSDEDANNFITGLKVKGTVRVGAKGRWIRGIGKPAVATTSRNMDFSGLAFAGAQNVSAGTFDMVDLRYWKDCSFVGMTVPTGAISLNTVRSTNFSVLAPKSALALSGTTTGLSYEGGVFASLPPDATGAALVTAGGVRLGTNRTYNKAGSAECASGLATELIAATSLTDIRGKGGFVQARSVTGDTAAAALVSIDVGGIVAFTPLGAESGAFSTDGQNIKFTSSAAGSRLVGCSVLIL